MKQITECLINLLQGKKARRSDWSEGVYCYVKIDEKGTNHWYTNNGDCIDGKYYKDMITGAKVWEIID